MHCLYWMSLFSLGSRLPGEPCDLFLISIIDAQNYDAYFFNIAWWQQISIWNKQIERSINLINQVGKEFLAIRRAISLNETFVLFC